MIYVGKTTDRLKLSDEKYERYDQMSDAEIVTEYRAGLNQCDIIAYYVKKNIGIIHLHTSKLYVDHNDNDDIGSLLFFAIHKGLMSFDISRNNRFSTYCFNVIYVNEIKMHLRKNRRRMENESLQHRVNKDEDIAFSEVEFFDVYTTDDSYEHELMEIQPVLDEFFTKLGKIDKKIIHLLMNGYSQKEIGKKIGISQSYVSRRIQRMKEKYIYLSERGI